MSGHVGEGVREEAIQLTSAIGRVLKESPAVAGVTYDILRRARMEIETALATATAGTTPTPTRLAQYLPYGKSPRRSVTDEELRRADIGWQAAHERGRNYREDAKKEIGTLLTPTQVGEHLGISRTTIANWRITNKLLGVQFDRHQYLYPAFQFVTSPEQGETGVVRYLDVLLSALGNRSAWWKARFLLAPAPELGGDTPLQVLHGAATDSEPAHLLMFARHSGEMGR
jgi:hypothetical protein